MPFYGIFDPLNQRIPFIRNVEILRPRSIIFILF